MIKYRLEEHITAETVCVDSDIYSLEYCSKGDDQVKLFLGIPLLVFDGRKYYPVFGKRYIDNYIKIQHYLPYSFIVEKTENPCEVLTSLIHLKKEMHGFNVIEKALTLKKLHDVDGKVDMDMLKMHWDFGLYMDQVLNEILRKELNFIKNLQIKEMKMGKVV